MKTKKNIFLILPFALVIAVFIMLNVCSPAKNLDFCDKCGGTYVLEYSYRSFNHNTHHYECTHCRHTIDITVKEEFTK